MMNLISDLFTSGRHRISDSSQRAPRLRRTDLALRFRISQSTMKKVGINLSVDLRNRVYEGVNCG
ncbi:hypothetical protein KIN20_035705 [Parelaphostrongylus tenuis]|uniref:Uncharacterized protein n=1 Tax=Parelaphostrongylus tenuis TaxID=148309 RepID=A0AAD5RBI9_PARTN|nr:hypothetical protein KIN20_035705 [Parelaphostrongylus tenuis]